MDTPLKQISVFDNREENLLKSSSRLTTLVKKLKSPLKSDAAPNVLSPTKTAVNESPVKLNRNSSMKYGISMWKALLDRRKSASPLKSDVMSPKSLGCPVKRTSLCSIGWSSTSLSFSSSSGTTSLSRTDLNLPVQQFNFLKKPNDSSQVFMTKKVQNIAQNQDANLYFQSTLRRVAKHQKIEFKPPVSPLTPMGLEPQLPEQTSSIKDKVIPCLPDAKKTDSENNVEESVPDSELVPPQYYSVSTYRKQIQEFAGTPLPVKALKSATANNGLLIDYREKQIQTLRESIITQQNVIAQASHALNICRATEEFCGSTEQAEGERVLLVATLKRQAAVKEMQRLEMEAALKVIPPSSTFRGTLLLSRLVLPFKEDAVHQLSYDKDNLIHYFLVLIRHHGQVTPFQMVSIAERTTDGSKDVLQFEDSIDLHNVPSYFEIDLEVYTLPMRQEKMEHNTKYHISKENYRPKLSTPKKIRRLLSRPSIASPGGPTAVLGSGFYLVGTASITSANMRQQQWTILKDCVPFCSPFGETLSMTVECRAGSTIEKRGFLNVFDDVAGFGAWRRLWCLLYNDALLFWKDPNHEGSKDPFSRINLMECVTESVEGVSYDVCARSYSFLLSSMRPPQKTDKNSLVMTCHLHATAMRHLLSADSKEERQSWCSKINLTLANLRAWNAPASTNKPNFFQF